MTSSHPPDPREPVARHPARDQPERRRGYLGTTIPMHRALWHLRLGSFFWPQLVLLPSLANAAQLWIWPLVRRYWQDQFLFWTQKVGVASQVALRASGIPWVGDTPSPYVVAGLPSTSQWWVGLALVAVLLLVSMRLPDALLPVRYLLRFVAFIQASAQLYFLFYAASYPYESATYLSDVVQQSTLLWFFLPWLLALVYLVLMQSAWRYLLLVALSAAYLVLLTPFLYSLHAWVLVQGSLLAHPALYLLGTLMLQIIALIGLYSWALTWRGAGDAGH